MGFVMDIDTKIELKEIKSLFQHNIFKYKINPNLYNKKNIVETINHNFSKQRDRNYFDNKNLKSSNLHHSYNDIENNKLPSPDYSSLLTIYENVFKQLYSNINFKPGVKLNYCFEIVNYTCTNKNQFMRKHCHLPSSDFSSIHYLQFDKEHSPTLFYNPGAQIAKSYGLVKTKFVDNLNFDAFSNLGYLEYAAPKFEEDDMIIFPSYLEHEIPQAKKQYKRNRITIITNTWIK